MKKLALPLMILTLGLSIGIVGCSDDDNSTNPIITSDFEGYKEWTQVEYTNAPADFLGPAHQGDNPDYVRAIYTSSPGKIEGDYPVGTIFVKETYTFDNDGNKMYPEAMGILGMIKRAEGFDTPGGNWEYFNINEDLGTIASGADLGSCKSCHANATDSYGEDHIFTHPYEHIVDGAAFTDFASWSLIDTEQGPDDLLGEAHVGNDANAVRKIYKKQLQANPNSSNWNGYPVGTIFLKTVQDAGENIIGKTAMVKRGAGFDPSHGGWEYFMMDMESGQMMAMGDNSTMCIGCHSAANTGSNGQDYVFAHAGDPFNN